ncbi:MAG: hypothetical protein R2867_15640 [Caldilineaceae bacterium]
MVIWSALPKLTRSTWRSLAYEISTMRLHNAIGGYVITEFTDVHWECNGLLDMQRNVKAGLAEHLTPLNQDRVVVARPQRWSGRPGDTLPVEFVAFGVDGVEQAGLLRWQAGEASGELAAPGGLAQIPLQDAGILVVAVQWVAANGQEIARNQVELTCVDLLTSQARLQVIDDQPLADTLVALGYQITSEPDAPLVATRYTKSLQDAVQQGASLLLIAGPEDEAENDRAHLPIGQLVSRAGTGWQGDWATSFSWLRKEGPFATLPGYPLLEMAAAEIMPDAVLKGVPARAFPDIVWAGLALGWIHKPVSLLHKAPYGSGEILVTTFKLNATTLQENVVAQAIFAGCVELLSL